MTNLTSFHLLSPQIDDDDEILFLLPKSHLRKLTNTLTKQNVDINIENDGQSSEDSTFGHLQPFTWDDTGGIITNTQESPLLTWLTMNPIYSHIKELICNMNRPEWILFIYHSLKELRNMDFYFLTSVNYQDVKISLRRITSKLFHLSRILTSSSPFGSTKAFSSINVSCK